MPADQDVGGMVENDESIGGLVIGGSMEPIGEPNGGPMGGIDD